MAVTGEFHVKQGIYGKWGKDRSTSERVTGLGEAELREACVPKLELGNEDEWGLLRRIVAVRSANQTL
jgi:hypothetical protein